MKSIMVITHERSGTHLVINCINREKRGQFFTIGYIPENNQYNLKNYKHAVYKDLMVNAYIEECVCKSHHQVEFMNPYLDFLFSKYYVIYVKRDIKDVLTSYYKFISNNMDYRFPTIDDWVFSKPDDIGRKFLNPYFPDPHVITEPENYIHRWTLHTNGWLKHKDNMLVINYEDVLLDYHNQKNKIESYINKKISNTVPSVNDKSLPNFGPVKGIVGGHKEMMSIKLIEKIDNYMLTRNRL